MVQPDYRPERYPPLLRTFDKRFVKMTKKGKESVPEAMIVGRFRRKFHCLYPRRQRGAEIGKSKLDAVGFFTPVKAGSETPAKSMTHVSLHALGKKD